MHKMRKRYVERMGIDRLVENKTGKWVKVQSIICICLNCQKTNLMNRKEKAQ